MSAVHQPDTPRSRHLFEVYGIEVEYMLVQRDTLDVLPVADRLLKAVTGAFTSEARVGSLTWSNELVLRPWVERF